MSESKSEKTAGRGTKPEAPSVLGRTGFGLSVLCVLAMVLAGFGSRLGWWHFGTGFSMLKWAVYGALTASVLSLTTLIAAVVQKTRRNLLLGAAGLAIGISSAWVPWSWLQAARTVPPIHDITTDMGNPPKFVAILPLRVDAPNPSEYGGAELAAQQRAGYPDLAPAILPDKPEIAFEKALAAARELGWAIVDADPEASRIEATDTTFWFGFKDDIVVRVSGDAKGSRVDVRSASRVGKSDVGTNAGRIRDFLDRLY